MRLEKVALQPLSWWKADNGKVPNAKGQPKRQQIQGALHSSPGLTAGQIANQSKLSISCINYHLDCMSRWGQVSCYRQPQTNRRYYFPPDYQKKQLEWSPQSFYTASKPSCLENERSQDKRINALEKQLEQVKRELKELRNLIETNKPIAHQRQRTTHKSPRVTTLCPAQPVPNSANKQLSLFSPDISPTALTTIDDSVNVALREPQI